MNYYVFEHRSLGSKQISRHVTSRAVLTAAKQYSTTTSRQVYAERHKRNPRTDRLEVITIAIFENGERVS
jgi:hypothetical protein